MKKIPEGSLRRDQLRGRVGNVEGVDDAVAVLALATLFPVVFVQNVDGLGVDADGIVRVVMAGDGVGRVLGGHDLENYDCKEGQSQMFCPLYLTKLKNNTSRRMMQIFPNIAAV